MNALFSSPVSLFAVSPGLTIGLIVSTRNQPWRLVPVDKLWTARGNQTAVLTGSAENMANLRCVSKNVATIGRRRLLKACRLIGCAPGIWCAPAERLTTASFSGCGPGVAKSGFRHFPQQGGTDRPRSCFSLAPRAGFEPATQRLTASGPAVP